MLATLLIVGLLAADRLRLLWTFAFRYTAQDQATLWYAARDLASLHFQEPFFYGQTYLTNFEALLAAPLVRLGLPPHLALPSIAIVLSTGCWVLFALSAWRRRAYLLSLALLSGPIVLVTEYSMFSAMPLGFVPGIFMASLAAFLALNPARSRLIFFLFGLTVAIAFSFNPSSVLLTIPVALHVWITSLRDPNFYKFAVPGLLNGVFLHGLGLYFYTLNPSYNLHPAPEATIEPELILEGLRHIGRYIGWIVPEVLPRASVGVVGFLALCALLVSTKKLQYLIPAVAGLSVAILMLGMPKTHDGSTSLYFPYSRFYLALPLLMSLLALMVVESRGRSVIPLGRFGYALLLLLVGISFVYKQASLSREVGQIIETAAQGKVILPDQTEVVLSACKRLEETAQAHDVDLIVHLSSPMYAYGCGAVLYGRVATLFPYYDRRTWRMFEEDVRTRDRILLSEAGEICERGKGVLTSCEIVSDNPRVAYVTFDRQPLFPLLRKLGLPVRDF